MKRRMVAMFLGLATLAAAPVVSAQTKAAEPPTPAQDTGTKTAGAPLAPVDLAFRTVTAFMGTWKVEGSVILGDEPPRKFKFSMPCKVVAGGRAVSCTMEANVPGLGPYIASYLIAHDDIGGRTHFMAVSTAQEVHDHKCTWEESKLVCDPLKYGPNTEDLTFTWTDPKNMRFYSATTMAGGGKIIFDHKGKRPSAPPMPPMPPTPPAPPKQ